MSLKRRDFLKETAAGVASVVTVSTVSESAQAATTPQVGRKVVSTDPFALIPLTDKVRCSRIGFGMGMRGGNNLRALPEDTAMDLLNYAYDIGMRLFDTADSYKTHPVLEKAMRGKKRDSYSIVSKFYPGNMKNPDGSRMTARNYVERFLKELNTDYIDVLQLHCQIKTNWPEICTEYMQELEELKKAGLIRAHGVTTHSLVAVQAAAKTPWVDTIHVRLNPLNIRMDGNWEDNVKALEDCHNAGQGTIIMKVIGEGTFREAEQRKKSTDAIVRLDAADVMVVGFESRAEIDEFVKNVSDTLKDLKSKVSK